MSAPTYTVTTFLFFSFFFSTSRFSLRLSHVLIIGMSRDTYQAFMGAFEQGRRGGREQDVQQDQDKAVQPIEGRPVIRVEPPGQTGMSQLRGGCVSSNGNCCGCWQV